MTLEFYRRRVIGFRRLAAFAVYLHEPPVAEESPAVAAQEVKVEPC